MLERRQTTNQGPSFQVLTPDQCDDLHRAALEILERTGVHVFHEEARQMLREAGAAVDGDSVRIPAFLVEESLRAAPKRIVVSDRNRENRLYLEGRNVYFSPPLADQLYLDPHTGETREFVRDDLPAIVKVADHLPNMDLLGMGTIITDVPGHLSGRVVFKEILKNSVKPFYFEALDSASLTACIEMACAVRGGADELRKDPYVIHYCEPISPLTLPQESVENLLICADHGVPVIYIPLPMVGQSAPATLAGTLAQNTAESLSGLVITQLRRRGTPFVFGGIPSVLDMRTSLYSYGAVELNLLVASLSEMSLYYGLPMFGTAGCSDSCTIDEQTAVEYSMSCLMSALSGANLVHDIGILAGGMAISPEALVLADEIIEMIRHMLRPIDINSESLALDLIHEVGPGGTFLAEEHTLRHFRECWYSDLFYRGTFKDWESKGSKRLADRINEKAVEILESYEPEALPESTLAKLDDLEDSWGR